MTAQFSGSYTVTITPFTTGGAAIDYAAWAGFSNGRSAAAFRESSSLAPPGNS